jgi:hypothetical protein
MDKKYIIFFLSFIVLLFIYAYAYYSGYNSHETLPLDFSIEEAINKRQRQDMVSLINQRDFLNKAYDNQKIKENNFCVETTTNNITDVISAI